MPRPSRRRRAEATGLDLGSAFDEHAGALFGFALNTLRDRGLAEDCVQEAFLRAWRARDRFDPDRGSERTWLFAIVRNVLVDVQRSLQRMPRIQPPETMESESPADTPDPLERLEVVEALAKLTAEHRSVVVAVHLRGVTYTELATATGIPVATLRTRAFYALRALRAHLDGGSTA